MHREASKRIEQVENCGGWKNDGAINDELVWQISERAAIKVKEEGEWEEARANGRIEKTARSEDGQ